MPTAQTGQGMGLVFDKLRLDRWQFTDLMTLRSRVCTQQQCAACFTFTRFANHEAGYLFRWLQSSSMPLVPWLPPSLPFSLCFRRRFLHMGRVTRWWLGRVTRILAHLFFQLPNLFLQLRHKLLHFLDSRQQRVNQCLHTAGCCFPILVENAGRWLSFDHLLIMLLFCPFVYPLFVGLTLVQLPT